MPPTLYSKLVPGCTAEVLGGADSAGRFPAYILGDHPDYPVLAASIVLDEWSETELDENQTVPSSTPIAPVTVKD